jgi:arginyl-tRNA synthetase
VFYLQDLAAGLHRYYNRHRILGDEVEGRMSARLVLLGVVRRVLAAGLVLLGVSAPERM